MLTRSGYRVGSRELAGVLTLGILLACCPRLTAGTLDGRLLLAFQDLKAQQTSQRYLNQNLEMTVRDKLFEKNNLALSLYLDNSRNLTEGQTTLRYRGQMVISNNFYSLNARFTPKQKITALEARPSREISDNEYLLDVHVPKLPQVRLFYGRKRQYGEGSSSGFSRDIRGDIKYRYKILEVALNRRYEKSDNGSQSKTTVTGGSARLSKSFRNLVFLNSGYERYLTETFRTPGVERNVTNQTFTTLLSSRYKKIVLSSISLVTRRLHVENDLESRGRNDTYAFQATLLPGYPIRLDLARNYLLSKQDTSRTVADYVTTKLVLIGPISGRANGRAEIARRYVVESTRGVIPANLYYASLRSEIFRGIDFRFDFNVSQRDEAAVPGLRYQTTTNTDLFLRPKEGLTIAPYLRFIKYSERFSLLRNDRRAYGFSSTYFPARGLNLGFDIRRNVVTKGRRQENTSAVFNIGFTARTRSTLNVSYGINDVDIQSGSPAVQTEADSRGTTLNVQTQHWISRRISLSFNYSRVERDGATRSEYMTVQYRHDF